MSWYQSITDFLYLTSPIPTSEPILTLEPIDTSEPIPTSELIQTSIFDENCEILTEYANCKIIVMFYISWSQYEIDRQITIENCDYNTSWSQLEKQYLNHPQIKVEKVNCETNPIFATKYSISNFNTIKMFWKGQVYDYDGNLTIESFNNFIQLPKTETITLPTHTSVFDKNYQIMTEFDNRKVIVLFYMPWCPHSQALIRNYYSAWSLLETQYQNHPEIIIEKVNCEVNSQLVKSYSIDGFPTIRMFWNGQIYDYQNYDNLDGCGFRTINSFNQFIECPQNYIIQLPMTKIISLPINISVFDKNYQLITDYVNRKVVVLFYAPWCPHSQELIRNDQSSWSLLETQYQNHPEIIVEKVDCEVHSKWANNHSIVKFPTILMFWNGQIYDFDNRDGCNNRTIDSFIQFIECPQNYIDCSHDYINCPHDCIECPQNYIDCPHDCIKCQQNGNI